MIDTIRFKIPIYYDDLQKIQENFARTEKIAKNGELEYRITNDSLDIGSHNYFVQLYIPKDGKYVYIEYSVPKFILGTNVYMADEYDLLETVRAIKKEVPELTNVTENWLVTRLDLCYNWKFDSDVELITALNVLHMIDYPRKKKYIYDTSVMYKGSAYTTKFYLKHPEFLKHDFKKLLRKEKEYAYEAYIDSVNVLRYEMTIRSSHLKYITGLNIVTLNDIIGLDYKEILNKSLSKFNEFLNEDAMTENSVMRKLNKEFIESKAIRLFMFWKSYYSGSPVQKMLIEKNLTRQSIWRNKKDLQQAGIKLNSKSPTKAKKLNLRVD